MLKITRRPYTACAYRWALSTSGISVGEGDCSESQCADLNGDFELDFSACASRHGKLVWAGDCETGDGSTPDCKCPRCQDCKQSPANAATIVSGLDADGFSITCYTQTQPGDSGFIEYCPVGTPREKYISIAKCVDRKGVEKTFCSTVHDAAGFLGSFESGLRSCNDCEGGCLECGTYQFEIAGVSGCVGEYNTTYVIDGESFTEGTCQWGEPAFAPGAVYAVMDSSSGTLAISNGTETTTYSVPGVIGISPSSGPPGAVTGTLSSAGCGTGWPTTITIEIYSVDGKPPSHDVHDRIRSKWHLEYDIEEELWTLRSFNKVDYPIYTLSDSAPCDGDTKTLLLADKGDAADGCGVAPPEVTITRVCPPDRGGKSALLEDRKPNGATGKRKRQCGCDCLDEVDDRRHTCETKCADSTAEGCESIDPTPDDITCRFPEAIDCCEHTQGKDVPCAYVVEFECDIHYGEGYDRTKIAAKQVVLRRECYFEDPCRFVAVGAESSTGGSPVMDVDGFPGAQPSCASCADDCLTGCTWDAWTVAECPDESCEGCECGLPPHSLATVDIPSAPDLLPEPFAGQTGLVIDIATCRSSEFDPYSGNIIEDGTGSIRGMYTIMGNCPAIGTLATPPSFSIQIVVFGKEVTSPPDWPCGECGDTYDKAGGIYSSETPCTISGVSTINLVSSNNENISSPIVLTLTPV